MTPRYLLALLAGALLAFSAGPASAVGFQWAMVPDSDGQSLEVAIWYPSDAGAAPQQFGPFRLTVAPNGAVAGTALPLVLISHGTGGSALNSYDTGIALAEAGFVVAAVTHGGDNYKERSSAFTPQNFAKRAQQISQVIDHMLGRWPGRGSLDPARIGIFGHSAGGTTALIAIGGKADWGRVVAFCRETPDDWGCRNGRQRGNADAAPDRDMPMIVHADGRIKAAVVAAPALAVAFAPDGLADVKVPVQLWVAADDTIVPNAVLFRSLLPTPPDDHLVARAGHYTFLAPCGEALAARAPHICKDADGFDRPAFLRTFQQSMIAFFRQRLVPAP